MALPAHHLDYFLTFCTLLARQKSLIAQGLCDAGVVQLLETIRSGWYPYLPAEDFEPPEVRNTILDGGLILVLSAQLTGEPLLGVEIFLAELDT